MNCRPGDLAIIRGVEPRMGLNGRPVELANEPAFMSGGYACWKLAKRIELTMPVNGHSTMTGQHFAKGEAVYIAEMPDCFLRPIRGDDISDEEVRELYAPNCDEVHHA